MSPYDFWRLYYRTRFNTRVFMSRHRLSPLDARFMTPHKWIERLPNGEPWTETELRAAWGDR